MSNQPNTSSPVWEESLLREIDALIDVLALNKSKDDNRTELAIIRLIQDVSLDQWEAFSARHGLSHWIAVRLNEKRVKHLTSLQEKLDHLVQLASIDPLTGLNNRRAFDHALRVEIERSYRLKTPLSLAIVDLDNFKTVNDTHGHPCGDLVLEAIGRVLQDHVRKMDFAGRIGGEEFTLILSGCGLIKAMAVLERLQEKIRGLSIRCPQSNQMITPTCSIGLVCYKGRSGIEPAAIIEEADKALYQAKQQGKNRVIAAPLLATTDETVPTVVLGEEKQFLFTGN